MRYKPLAPVPDEVKSSRKPFVEFVSETVDSCAGNNEQLIEELENFAYRLLLGIDGFYIASEAKVDLIARATGETISADLHSSFEHCRFLKKKTKVKHEMAKAYLAKTQKVK